jgi:hypothetical protein
MTATDARLPFPLFPSSLRRGTVPFAAVEARLIVA